MYQTAVAITRPIKQIRVGKNETVSKYCLHGHRLCRHSTAAGAASGAEEAPTLVDAFKQGSVKGQLKSYYFTQTLDGEGLDDSEI